MTQQQADFFPWDEIPDQDVLEAGDYLVRGASLEDGLAGTGKRMFVAQMSVEEPKEASGMFLFENFVTGTEEAQTAIMPGTLGTRRLKRMLGAAQIPASNNTAQLCKGFEGVIFGVSVSKYEEKSGEYAGSIRNRIGAFWKVGEKQPQIGAVVKSPAAVAQPVVQAPQGAPAPLVEQATQTVGSVAPPPPTTGATTPASPPPPSNATAPQGQPMLNCSICGQNIPSNEFAAHVQQCAAQHETLEER